MLTDTKVRALKPKPASYRVSDSGGLYLQVQPNGSRLWRLAYRFGGKQKTAAFGAYPDVSVAEARAKREDVKRTLREGRDPAAVRAAETKASETTFAVVVEEWWDRKVIGEGRSVGTQKLLRWSLDALNADIGARPLAEIEPPELLAALRKAEAAGAYSKASRMRGTASAVFRFGIASGYCNRDPAADLKGAITANRSTPHAAVTDPDEIGELMRAIEHANPPRVRLALKLLALTAVRPGELVSAEWSEIEGDVWDIPGPKMKMRLPHRVPLSRQARAVLEELRKITGNQKHLFASTRPDRTIATNQLNIGLAKIGFDNDRHVGHGFRSTFSTSANESGKWSADVIELSLAHVPTGVRAIYNRSKYWPERVALMQWWGDHLDELRSRGKVVAIRQMA
jgi:integrase